MSVEERAFRALRFVVCLLGMIAGAQLLTRTDNPACQIVGAAYCIVAIPSLALLLIVEVEHWREMKRLRRRFLTSVQRGDFIVLPNDKETNK